jgi:glycosyltransferase involved in cell wall biosynthesis
VLRIAIDATPLLGPRTGVGVMTERLLEHLAMAPDVTVTAFAITWRGRAGLRDQVPPGITVTSRPVPARAVHAAWRHFDLPPVEWLAGACDVVHGPNFVVPPARRAARVVTVHDLTCVHFPELCTPHSRRYPELIARAVADGAFVHTVSSFVRDEVLEHFDVPPERVVAIANGVDPVAAAAPERGHELAGGDRYVLAVGTVEPRKRLPELVAAFDRVATSDPTLRLVLAGPDGWGVDDLNRALAAARHDDRIVRLGWVSNADRAALLRGATALAYPSRYEGFGLPPLESMAAGVPTLVSDAGALPEIVGDAALVVPAADPNGDALAAGLDAIVHDDQLRQRLVVAGSVRVAEYRWEDTATRMLGLYRLAALA